MAKFPDPFPGVTQIRPMTLSDLIRVLRMDLTAEEEAIFLYTAHADATDNPLAARVLRDIANEEIVHAGELTQLITMLSEEEQGLLAKGANEVREMAKEVVSILGS
jgi:rubrerythrin